MNLLILKGFNNYFNRKIKKYSDLQDYIDNSSASYRFVDINFNPNDGVATSQVIGSENQKQPTEGEPIPLDWENDGSPDYLVCYESRLEPDPENENLNIRIDTIKSRWFVMESVRTRNGQYQLALKRDIIADHLEQILTNPCFVEKGYVPANSPLIFNDEGVSFNQIKQSETMLKDETGIPWLVLYIAKNFPASNTPDVDANGNLPIIGNTVLDSSNAIDISSLPWYNIISSPDVSKTYRVPGAAELNISPIVALKHQRAGTPNVFVAPYRVNSRWFYSGNNDWTFDNNTSNYTKLGDKELSPNLFGTYILTRGDIKLTPKDNLIHWNDDGVIVPGMVSASTINSIGPIEDNIAEASSQEAIQLLRSYKGIKTNSMMVSKWNNIKTYLNNKRTNFESNTLHSPVPGQPNMEAYVGGNQAFLPASTILSYNNKLIKSGVNYYRLKITRQNNYIRPIDYFTLDGNNDIQPSSTNTLGSSLPTGHKTAYKIGGVQYIVSWNPNASNSMIETFFENAWFDIQYERVQTDKLKMILDKPGVRIGLNEAAYDMICLPYGAIDYILPNDANNQDLAVATTSKEASIGMARSIAAQIDSSCYDMQLLPYCPYRQVAEQYAEDGYVNLGLTRPFPTGCWFGVYSVSADSDPISRTNRRSFGLYCPSCSGTFNINHAIEVPTEDSVEYKLFSATRKFRLVSPNYSSIFEFNPLKNLGVTIFNVDFNYRPYNPYIHIAPYFNADGLYGVDTNDNRGLILQGDFSVGYYSSAWANYQIQNANYANIFNREIQNMDTNFKYDVFEQAMVGGFDAVSNTFNTALAGSNWGNPIADALGGTFMLNKGFQGQLFGAGVDAALMGLRYKEAKNYKKDIHNLQLGNVKALPYGLAKSDALNENFKYFPFIEEYDCTEVEKEIMRSKLTYDGMTVAAIGTIQDYLPVENWGLQKVKGRMIMMENISDDFHIANDIYEEVDKGFYLVNTEEQEGD